MFSLFLYKKNLVMDSNVLRGRITCHINLIKESYRARGKHLRNKRKNTPIIKLKLPIKAMNTSTVIIEKITTIPYSLRNRNTKVSLPNSRLNPLISSLSPSRRSNGARLVSINESNIHIMIHNILNSIKGKSNFEKKRDLAKIKKKENYDQSDFVR